MREIIDGLGYMPKTCTWELTLACNLRCGHCGSSAGKPRPGELSRERSLEIVRELDQLGCRRITLSGGEPTLSPHWEAIASEAATCGVRVNMITNGLRADRSSCRSRQAGRSRQHWDQHRRSRRGARPRTADIAVCTDESCASSTICHGVGLPVGVIHHDSASKPESTRCSVRVARGAGVRMAASDCQRDGQPVEPAGADRAGGLAPVDPRSCGAGGAGGALMCALATNIGYYGPYEKVLRKHRSCPVDCWVGCYAGCRHVGIESDGGVKGCLSVQATRATEGNLHESTLSEIWHREGAFAYNRQFRRTDLAGFCATCEHADVCRGGCLSMRTCEGGRENPFCYHRVATLAERAASSRRRHYVPLVLAPAALLASFGLGCGASQPAPTPGPATTAQPAGRSDPDEPMVVAVDEPEPVGVDEYGMPDIEPVEEYGMPEPEPPVVSEYAVVEPDPPGVDEYGMNPPD